MTTTTFSTEEIKKTMLCVVRQDADVGDTLPSEKGLEEDETNGTKA